MSGIYIKGMEMPEPGKVRRVFIASDGRCYKNVYEAAMEVDSFAEAIPVPPHGRLGDLDAMVVFLENNSRALTVFDAIHEIERMPTIIPADKEAEP